MKQYQSDRILALLDSSTKVEAAIETHAAAVAARLVDLFSPSDRAVAEGAGVPDFLAHLMAYKAQLGTSREALGTAEGQQIGLDRRAVVLRRERDDLTARLARDFARIGQTVEGLYRDAAAPIATSAFIVAGLQGPSASRPVKLLRQVELALEFLRQPGLVLPQTPLLEAPVDPGRLVAVLEPTATRLARVIADLELLRRQMMAGRMVKNRALADHESTYSLIARGTEVLFRLAGETELAERIRPSVRRASDGSGDDGTGGEPDEGDPDGDPDGTSTGDDPASVPAEAPAAGEPTGLPLAGSTGTGASVPASTRTVITTATPSPISALPPTLTTIE